MQKCLLTTLVISTCKHDALKRMSDKDIKVTIISADKTVSHCKGQSLLETLENNGVEVHFHCRSGFCGACRTKLKSGEVEYKEDPLAFIADDEILPCCCEPVSDIEVEFE